MFKFQRILRCQFNVRFKATFPVTRSVSAHDAELELTNNVHQMPLPFSSAKVGNFSQEPPQLDNQYLQDTLLRSFLKRHIPSDVSKESTETRLKLLVYKQKLIFNLVL